jgi:hypothetical protein
MAKEYGPATEDQRLQAVKEHAKANYNQGWDLVADTMSDQDILEAITGTTTRYGAIERLSRQLKPLWELRKETT